jgi:hypothetical protein
MFDMVNRCHEGEVKEMIEQWKEGPVDSGEEVKDIFEGPHWGGKLTSVVDMMNRYHHHFYSVVSGNRKGIFFKW